MKVLHIIRDLDINTGGPVSAVFSVAKMQSSFGEKVTILSTADQFKAETQDENINVILTKTQLRKWRYSSQFKKIARIEIMNCDIVHIHTIWEYPTFIVSKLCRKLGKPYILRPCGMLDDWAMSQGGRFKQFYFSIFGKAIIKHASGIHFTSLGEQSSSQNYVENRDTFVLPIPIKNEYLPQNNSHQIPVNKEIVFVGRIHPHKRIDVLINAFKNVIKLDSNVKLSIAGNGDPEYIKYLKNVINDLGLNEHIIWKGLLNTDQLIDLYQRAYVLVLPSMHENFGNVLVEAMSQGCPVIMSKEVHINKSIEDSGSGLTVEGNSSSIAECLIHLLKDSEVRDRMALSAIKFVKENYIPDVIYPKLHKQYESILERNSRGLSFGS